MAQEPNYIGLTMGVEIVPCEDVVIEMHRVVSVYLDWNYFDTLTSGQRHDYRQMITHASA